MNQEKPLTPSQPRVLWRMWNIAGLCIDSFFFYILIQQWIAIRRLSADFDHWLVNLGLIFGGLFTMLVRITLFHAFERIFKCGDRLWCQDGMGKVEKVGLLLSTIKMKNGEHKMFWNLETQIKLIGKGIKDEQDVICWNAPYPWIIYLFDTLFIILSIAPIAVLFSIVPIALAVYSSAAICATIYVVLMLSLQIGVLRNLGKSQTQSQNIIYQGAFISLCRTTDGYIMAQLNASTQVTLAGDRFFGPYI